MTDNNFLLFCAFRYCMDRKSYAVGWMQDILDKRWSKLSLHIQNLLLRDMSESINTWNQEVDMTKPVSAKKEHTRRRLPNEHSGEVGENCKR